MSEKTIVVVDDERSIVSLVKLYLEAEGYRVAAAYDGNEGVHLIQTLRPALVVLDLMLPGINGFELCRTVRRESDVPIIILTARSDDVDKIVGLELGADDYVAKPFNPRELVARVKAILRRTGAAPVAIDAPVTLGNTVIDTARHEVTVGGEAVALRSKEFDLLKMFAQHLGLVLDRDKLLNQVWGYEYFGDTRTVDVHVAHLRDRLAGSSLQIQTVRGAGYKLVLDEPVLPC
ncbi:MAG TPA: response regulator transcription factor [Chloroflexia bacterium]|nr:response regulator transcription factor [Chloroflexia bacterium]